MCYLENFRHFAAFGVQSNTFSFTYANFFKKNYHLIAHSWGVCAKFRPFFDEFHYKKKKINEKAPFRLDNSKTFCSFAE